MGGRKGSNFLIEWTGGGCIAADRRWFPRRLWVFPFPTLSSEPPDNQGGHLAQGHVGPAVGPGAEYHQPLPAEMAQERDDGARHDLGRCAPSPVLCAVRVLCSLVPVDADDPLARAAQAKWCSRTSSCGSTCCRRSWGCRSSLRAASSRYGRSSTDLRERMRGGNPSGKPYELPPRTERR